VISGGEPTLQKDLDAFVSEIKRMGFRVKLDTNGSNPDMIEHLMSIGCVDRLFRTTVFRPLLRVHDLKQIVNLLRDDPCYLLQKCEARKGMKKSILTHVQYPKNAIERFQKKLRSHI